MRPYMRIIELLLKKKNLSGKKKKKKKIFIVKKFFSDRVYNPYEKKEVVGNRLHWILGETARVLAIFSNPTAVPVDVQEAILS
jgi:hypothetical protein